MKGIVSFYEKPGCKGNARQKVQLKELGYVVQSVDMISKKWEQESLTKFFQGESPHQFVNQRAPIVTSGELDPSDLSEGDLLEQMVNNPILIKRPLLFFRGKFGVGFDSELAAELLGDLTPDTECKSTDVCE